ncbi:MAG: glycosyltransferase family 4 protein, partial [Lentisphaerae bacterium]|nr:glycosyltransferase family 4 protein [Lentisphaerota bacterium]
SIGRPLTIDWGMLRPADLHRIGGGIHRHFLRYNLAAYPRWMHWFKRLEWRKSKHARSLACEDRILANANATFLPISRFVAAQLQASHVPEERIAVLYNGVDTDLFTPERARRGRDEQRARWGVRDGDVVFAFVAHNLRLKNLSLLRRVFSRLHREGHPAKLLVIGKHRPAWRAEFLIYQPTTPDIHSCYGAADALVHPSFYDAFANVVFEAMSCELPAIVSDRSGVSELVTSGTDGIVLTVTEPDSDARWLDQIRTLATDEDLRSRLGAKGRQTTTKHPTGQFVDRFVEQVENKIRERNSA